MAAARTVPPNPSLWSIPLIALIALSTVGSLLPENPAPGGGEINGGDTAWMLTATALVLLMTPGLSFFYGGMVDRRNVLSTMLQSFIAMGLVSILWVTVGFSLAFGDSLGGVIGDPRTFFMFRSVGEAPTLPYRPPFLWLSSHSSS